MKSYGVTIQMKATEHYFTVVLGSLSNDDGDVNENGKKAIGLDWQNNNFALASRFFAHLFTVTTLLQRLEMPNFTFCGGREHTATTFFLLS